MKTSILISSLVSIIFVAPIVSANEMTLGNDPYSIRISANAQELLSVQPSSEVIVSDFRLAMMDEMEDMDKMKKKGGMGNMGGNMPPDDTMPNADSSGSMQDPMAAPPTSCMMGCMGDSMQKPSMKKMTPNSRLPGFPGASHLYHIGSTGFFLDHPQHITLSTEQQSALNRIKEKALLDRANFNRRIEDNEQLLWTLTAADAPDATKIDLKVRAIEKLRSDQRLAFIRAVGEAGKVLTSNQRAALLGTMSPTGKKPAPTSSSPTPTPTPMPEPTPMPDM
jgi:hypothetical protein